MEKQTISDQHPFNRPSGAFDSPDGREPSDPREGSEAFATPFFHTREIEACETGPAAQTSRWSVTWSTLMMIMFILFAVLYAYESANRRFAAPGDSDRIPGGGDVTGSAISQGNALQDTIREIYDISRRAVPENGGGAALVENKAVLINLSNSLLFKLGTAEFRPGTEKILDRVAEVIKKTTALVNVAGHTDSAPFHSEQFETNWELSAARSCAVVRYFVENAQASGERFFSSGHAYFQPRVPNTSPGNRAVNNRTEIIIWF